jgi:hypothetical protein
MLRNQLAIRIVHQQSSELNSYKRPFKRGFQQQFWMMQVNHFINLEPDQLIDRLQGTSAASTCSTGGLQGTSAASTCSTDPAPTIIPTIHPNIAEALLNPAINADGIYNVPSEQESSSSETEIDGIILF